MKIILYTTHCPKCMILEKKLKEANLEYTVVDDTRVMLDKGFMQAPILEVDDNAMDFVTANTWINNH